MKRLAFQDLVTSLALFFFEDKRPTVPYRLRDSLKPYPLLDKNTQVYFASDQIGRFRTRLRLTIYPLERHIPK